MKGCCYFLIKPYNGLLSLVQAICPLQKQHHKVLGATSFVDRAHPQFALNAITQLRFTQKGNLHKASVTDSATVSVFTEPPTKTSEALTLLKFPKEAGNCVRLSRGICTSGSEQCENIYFNKHLKSSFTFTTV